MSLLAHGLMALALLAVQEAKGDPKREEEAQVLQAVRNETELRDFAKALESWKSVQTAAEKAGKKELVTKAELGCARCLLALGRNDEAKAVLNDVLASDPKNAEAKSALAKFLAGGPVADDLQEIVDQLADVAFCLKTPQSDGRISSASDDLVRMSDVAIPRVAELLRHARVGVVDGAAKVLVQMNTIRAYDALAAAMKDPRCRYPNVLVGQVQRVGGDEALPFLVATLTRTEPELRRWAAERLSNNIGALTPEAQLDVARQVLADPEESVRVVFFENTRFSPPAVKLLVPTFQAMVDSSDEVAQKTAVFFLTRNRAALPNETVARWSAQLARSPNASVRRLLFDLEYNAATEAHAGDLHRRGLALLKYLADDDAAVFSAGASMLENDGNLSNHETYAGSGDALAAALNRALDLKGVSPDKRYAVLMRLPLYRVRNEDLFNLFVRLAENPIDTDEAWRASVRERIGDALIHPMPVDRRDPFAAERLLRIPDAAGRRQWFDLARRDTNNWPMTVLFLAAAKSDDVMLRVAAYRELSSGTKSDQLPHVAEDLQNPDPAVVLVAARAIGWGERPDLVKPLRDLIARGPGDLHDAALRALANVGGKAVADELLASMKETPKDRDFRYLRQLEQAIGAESLAKELVAVAKADGSSNRVVSWMRTDGNVTVSSECASEFVRQLPPNLVGTNVFDILEGHLAPDVLAALICRQLRDGKGYELGRAAKLAGFYHVDAAWNELVALLDAGAGQVREEAIASLQSIRQFRELRRSFAADDSDARRQAFDKARAMISSKSAEQRAGAAIALAATGDIAAIPSLLDLLGDGDESVRAAARKALEKLADRAAALPTEAPKHEEEKGADGGTGKKKQE